MLICFVIFWSKQQLMMHLIQKLSLNFHSFLDLYLSGIGSSIDNNRWDRISTSYWIKNLQLPFCLSIKSTHEFKWYANTLWPNVMKMLGWIINSAFSQILISHKICLLGKCGFRIFPSHKVVQVTIFL